MEAIRYGDLPETKAKLAQVIDERVGEGLPELIREQALHTQMLSLTDIERIRRDMEEARTRRLQPHHVEGFFRGALTELRGRITPRQRGRFEITHVPHVVRYHHAGILYRYERVCFDRQFIEPAPKADLIAPGHPLLDAVVQAVTERSSDVLGRGTILCARTDAGESARLTVSVRQEVVDGHKPTRPVLKRFSFVELNSDGQCRERTVEAPYLDYDPLTPAERDLARPQLSEASLADAPKLALSWAAGRTCPRRSLPCSSAFPRMWRGPDGW